MEFYVKLIRTNSTLTIGLTEDNNKFTLTLTLNDGIKSISFDASPTFEDLRKELTQQKICNKLDAEFVVCGSVQQDSIRLNEINFFKGNKIVFMRTAEVAAEVKPEASKKISANNIGRNGWLSIYKVLSGNAAAMVNAAAKERSLSPASFLDSHTPDEIQRLFAKLNP